VALFLHGSVTEQAETEILQVGPVLLPPGQGMGTKMPGGGAPRMEHCASRKRNE
jgi:hypothetical protein